MGFIQTKRAEVERAQKFVDEYINESRDHVVRYRESRPITDIKNMLETSVELYGDNVAFRQKFKKNEPYKSITYKAAYDDINGLGTALINRGQKGKRIAVIGETCYQWESSYLAVICGTGLVVPLDKELDKEDLEGQIIDAEISTIFFDNKYEKMFREIKAGGNTGLEILINFNSEEHTEDVLSWAALIKEGKNQVAQGDRSFADAEICGDEPAVILYTSGTTGIAKGVMLSHYNLAFDLMSAPSMLKVNSWDIFFSVLPVHHTYECTCAFLMPLYKGASIAYCQGLKYIVKNLEEVKPTMLLGVPVLIESLYKKIWKGIREKGKEDTFRRLLAINKKTERLGINVVKPFAEEILKVLGGNMRVLISGGAAINPDILEFFNALGIVAVQGYGLTECSPMVALNPDVRKDMRNRSAGHLLPGMEVKISDADENGIGEICFRGGNVMLGYYNNPSATADVIRDGWFHTGDLGYVDKDNYVFITGRKKNVIITKNGKNVFPEELEYLICQIPYINEAMVWGSEEEGEGEDTTIAATVTLDNEQVAEALGDGYTVRQVEALIWSEIDKINGKIPFFKRIKKLVVRKEDFEKTTGKKIKRFVDSNRSVNR